MISFLKKKAPFTVTIIALLLSTTLFPEKSYPQDKQPTWQVYFSPSGGCTEAIIRHLENAKSAVLIQAYSFTSAPIVKAVLNAHKRKVRVEVILDKSQETSKYSPATLFLNQGVPLWIDRRHAKAHNKVMIIDGKTVITGSFNFTKAAEENNAENLLVIQDLKIAQTYMKNFEDHKKHSTKKDHGA